MTETKSPETFQWTNVRNQYIATLSGALLPFCSGCIGGWVSPAISKLSSVQTPFKTGPLTIEEISWIGSISYVGAVLGTFTAGHLISFLGCKRTLQLMTIPLLLFWSLIYFGTNIYFILCARICSGWTVGVQLTAFLLYISEISNDSIRGRLVCAYSLAANIGIVIGYVLGATLDYRQIPVVCIFVPFIFLVVFTMLPNTPRYYLRMGKIEDAERALKWYTGYSGQSEVEKLALEHLFERLKLAANEKKSQDNWRISDFCNRRAIKTVSTCIALNLLTQFSANGILEKYAVTIFERTGTTLNPYKCSIILAVTHIFGSILVIGIVDKIGRKTSLMIFFIGSATGLITTSIFLYAAQNGYDLSHYAWVPVVCLCFVNFLSPFSISMTYAAESLSTKTRTLGLVVIWFMINVNGFILVKVFPILMNVIGLDCCLMILASVCTLAAMFVLFALDETRGKAIHDDIADKIPENNDFTEKGEIKTRY